MRRGSSLVPNVLLKFEALDKLMLRHLPAPAWGCLPSEKLRVSGGLRAGGWVGGNWGLASIRLKKPELLISKRPQVGGACGWGQTLLSLSEDLLFWGSWWLCTSSQTVLLL